MSSNETSGGTSRDASITSRFGGDVADVVAASVSAYGAELRGVRTAHVDGTVSLGAATSLTREEREAALDVLLGPAATRSRGAGNRAVEEEPDPVRTCFEKDLDRVRYSPAFRRLAHKCQVFIAPRNDHLRNRMTHALEVAQVATAVARAVGLNTALTEAAAVSHDCGHGPAGHASEEAFSPYLPDGYDHAVYGADVVLSPLNLCVETLDAVRNHSWRRPAPLTAEGEVVSWADRIAYVAHDFDDAVRAGIVTADDLPAEVSEVLGTTQSSQIGTMIAAMADCADRHGVIGMEEPYATALDAFRRVNYERIYLRPESRVQAEKVIVLLRALVDVHVADPASIPDVAVGAVPCPDRGSPQAAEAAVRYVSSMTDRYAITLAADRCGFRPEALPTPVD